MSSDICSSPNRYPSISDHECDEFDYVEELSISSADVEAENLDGSSFSGPDSNSAGLVASALSHPSASTVELSRATSLSCMSELFCSNIFAQNPFSTFLSSAANHSKTGSASGSAARVKNLRTQFSAWVKAGNDEHKMSMWAKLESVYSDDSDEPAYQIECLWCRWYFFVLFH